MKLLLRTLWALSLVVFSATYVFGQAQVSVDYGEYMDTRREIPVIALDATDLITPETGLTLTCERQLPGETAFSACAGTTSEIGVGVYKHVISRVELEAEQGKALYKFTNAAMTPYRLSVDINPTQYNYNILKNSSEFNSGNWVKTAIGTTANTTNTHDGLAIADTITATATASKHWIYSPIVADLPYSGDWYVASVEVLAGTATNFVFGVRDGNFTEKDANLTFSTGAIVHSTTVNGVLLERMKNGWYRLSILYKQPTGFSTYSDHRFVFGINNTALDYIENWTATGTETVMVARARIARAVNVEPHRLARMRPWITSASGTSVTLWAGEINSNDEFNGREICLYQENFLNSWTRLCRCITDYVGSTKVVTLATTLPRTLAVAQYEIGGTCESQTIGMNADVVTASAIAANAIGSGQVDTSAVTEIVTAIPKQRTVGR